MIGAGRGSMLLLVILGCVRCTPSDPLAAWTARVQQYVLKQGHGDPLVLRETVTWGSTRTLRPAELKLTALNTTGVDAFTGESDDVVGVYVGMATSGGRPWMFFLVGVNHRGARPMEIRDIRLTGFSLSEDPGRWDWVFSPMDASATARYRIRPSDVAKSAGSGNDTVVCFPDPLDVYEFKISGERISVVEQRSGARWTVRLTAVNSAPTRR